MGYAYLHGLSFVLEGFLMNDHPSGGSFWFPLEKPFVPHRETKSFIRMKQIVSS